MNRSYESFRPLAARSREGQTDVGRQGRQADGRKNERTDERSKPASQSALWTVGRSVGSSLARSPGGSFDGRPFTSNIGVLSVKCCCRRRGRRRRRRRRRRRPHDSHEFERQQSLKKRQFTLSNGLHVFHETARIVGPCSVCVYIVSSCLVVISSTTFERHASKRPS